MITLRTARAAFYEANGLPPDGRCADPWVDVGAGPLTVSFPNMTARTRMIPYHDLHHMLTGYRMNVAGEVELCAWEMAAGYRGFVPGWQLNSSGVAIGALLMPRRTWRAFLRGRRSHSLYGARLDEVLDDPLESVRQRVVPDSDACVQAADVLSFAGTVLAGLLVALVALPFVVILLPLGLALAALRPRD